MIAEYPRPPSKKLFQNGLPASYYVNLPSGPAIILTSGAGYLLSMLLGPKGGVVWQLVPRPHLEA